MLVHIDISNIKIPGLTKRTEVAEINEELIDITNHLLKRFSVFLSKQNSLLNKDVLIKDLLSTSRCPPLIF